MKDIIYGMVMETKHRKTMRQDEGWTVKVAYNRKNERGKEGTK